MTRDRLYPYVLEPKETAAIWGGDALVTRYGKRGDPAQPLGESWECWDDNRVVNGALAGRTLAELRAELGAELTGPADPHARFPVLTKIIDARAPLSVQVHPDDAYAQRVEGQPVGKTECWYILEADPGAELVLGWVRDTDRAEYERRVADGTLGELLRRVPVAAGDAFYLPAGTLHAIGAGIRLFEAQQASDLTYRIFDWNRVGADGKPRELHVAKAADVLDFRATAPGAVRPFAVAGEALERTLLIGDRRFLVERLVLRRGEAAFETDGRPLAILAENAHLRVDAGAGSAVLAPWQTCVVPAGTARTTLVPGGDPPAAALVVHVAPDLAAWRARVPGSGPFFAQFA